MRCHSGSMSPVEEGRFQHRSNSSINNVRIGTLADSINAGFNIVKERATILCCRHGKILLVDRGRSRWALPGGAIRRKEAPGDAALRELLEETSLVVSNVQYVFQFVGLNKRHHVFLSVLGDDFQARPANEIVRCCWIRPDEIGRFAASVPTREIVALLLGAGGTAKPPAVPLHAQAGRVAP